MTKMSDLPGDIVGEILSRVPMTFLSAVRSTCKKWDALSKNRIFGKAAAAAARKQFLGFMMMDYKVCSLRFDLHGIRNEGDLVDPSIKQIGKLNQVEISQVFHCDGLLLCVTKDHSSLVVWNPYLGQTRWIQPRHNFDILDNYALGYGSNNHNHKILRICDPYLHRNYGFEVEIYDFSSDSWRVLDVTPDWDIPYRQRGVSLNGNTYFFAKERLIFDGNGVVNVTEVEEFLLCFDFATESFVPRLPLPFHSNFDDTVTLSCVREEQLALLHQCCDRSDIMEIWVTTNIEPNVVSWSKFLEIDMGPLTGFQFDDLGGSLFIDDEKKVAVVFDLDNDGSTETCRYQKAYIIGQDGYFKSLTIREAPKLGKPNQFGYVHCHPLVCSYVPSLVQLQINQQPRKRKERDY